MTLWYEKLKKSTSSKHGSKYWISMSSFFLIDGKASIGHLSFVEMSLPVNYSHQLHPSVDTRWPRQGHPARSAGSRWRCTRQLFRTRASTRPSPPPRCPGNWFRKRELRPQRQDSIGTRPDHCRGRHPEQRRRLEDKTVAFDGVVFEPWTTRDQILVSEKFLSAKMSHRLSQKYWRMDWAALLESTS